MVLPTRSGVSVGPKASRADREHPPVAVRRLVQPGLGEDAGHVTLDGALGDREPLKASGGAYGIDSSACGQLPCRLPSVDARDLERCTPE